MGRLGCRRSDPQPGRVRLRRPEGQRRREQEPRRCSQHRDPHRADGCLALHRRRPTPRLVRPGIGSRDPESQHRWPDVDALPDRELARPGQALVVEEGPVLASQVLEEEPLAAPGEPRVTPADGRVWQPQIAAARATEDQGALAHREQLPRARPVLGVEEDLLAAEDGRDHRGRTDRVATRAPLATGAHRIRRHPLRRRIVRVEGRRLAFVERKLTRILGVLGAVLGWRSPGRPLGIRWRHAQLPRVPHPPAMQ